MTLCYSLLVAIFGCPFISPNREGGALTEIQSAVANEQKGVKGL